MQFLILCIFTMNMKNNNTFRFSSVSDHYENFPVASFLIPKEFRSDIAMIYWFARTADDLADEGNLSEQERINFLTEFENEFQKSLNGDSIDKKFVALSNVINRRKLSPEYFFNLISAFKQDVVKKRYSNSVELIDYCRRSANPIGRLILELFNYRDEKLFLLSDKICTALQLINFWQDTSLDIEKGRIYYPQEDRIRFNVSENQFEKREFNNNFKCLVKEKIKESEALINEGSQLIKYLKGRLKFEIAWTFTGGKSIINKIKQIDYNVLNKRVVIKKIELPLIIFKSMKYVNHNSKRNIEKK